MALASLSADQDKKAAPGDWKALEKEDRRQRQIAQTKAQKKAELSTEESSFSTEESSILNSLSAGGPRRPLPNAQDTTKAPRNGNGIGTNKSVETNKGKARGKLRNADASDGSINRRHVLPNTDRNDLHRRAEKARAVKESLKRQPAANPTGGTDRHIYGSPDDGPFKGEDPNEGCAKRSPASVEPDPVPYEDNEGEAKEIDLLSMEPADEVTYNQRNRRRLQSESMNSEDLVDVEDVGDASGLYSK